MIAKKDLEFGWLFGQGNGDTTRVALVKGLVSTLTGVGGRQQGV